MVLSNVPSNMMQIMLPEGILYPNNGYIVRADDPDTEINSFTQKDIDDNKV